jgi:BirA family biotin operon repressor/biotin-[acetyl-CoA-carboxylase] ligase
VADVARIVADTFVADVELHDSIASTNDRALGVAASAARLQLPLLILTDQQTAGRGRGTNQWWAGRGALTFSVLLEPHVIELSPAAWPLASLTSGLAVAEAIEGVLAGGAKAGVKWPNDVYLKGAKVAGILVETSPARGNTLIVGIGINVNNSRNAAPAELQSTAIALCDVDHEPLSRSDLLIRVLNRLWYRLSQIPSERGEICSAWRRRCILTGRSIELEAGQRRIAGRCDGIDDAGALLVQTERGPERCFSGVVVRFDWPTATS